MMLLTYVLQSGFLCLPLYWLSEALATSNLPSSYYSLPPQLERSMSLGLLVRPRENVYVLGTVHIGSESADEVEMLIEALRPDAIVLEMPPSRVERIRLQNNRKVDSETEPVISQKKSNIQSLLRALPVLAERGWKTGGAGGVLFAVGMLGGSILKKALSSNEESTKLPRKDEFAAAISAGDAVSATIFAADFEIDDIISGVSRSLSLNNWLSLGIAVIEQELGMRSKDPIRRMKDEAIEAWEERRRNVSTARASRKHGEAMAPELNRVLVDERDDRFSETCLNILESHDDVINPLTVVCIVGLVHLDGVAQRLQL